MGKMKLTLVSGAVIEKPLINAFRANNLDYVVLDNEMNGSMGLPIILVCKMVDNKLVKIVDQNEWQIVKEYLKNIIAGNQIEMIKVPMELQADDIYYTQLTLPVPSFDALKKAYSVVDTTPSTPEVNNPVNTNVDNTITNNNTNAINDNTNNNTASIFDINSNGTVSNPTPAPEVKEQIEVPQNPVTPTPEVAPVVNSEPQASMTSPVIDMPVTPEVNVGPVINPTIDLNTPIPTPAVDSKPTTPMPQEEVKPINNEMFKEQKEAFLLACENMFDALVQKFEKELENRH